MIKQDSLENISKMLYGNKYNKKEENNSFLNQSKDNNINNYKIKPIKDSTPQELLYGAKKQEDKNKEDKKTNPTNIKPIKDLTPQELLYGVKDKGKERKNSTPIEDLKTRQEYLKRGYSTKNDGLIPGVNESSINSKKTEKIYDNRILSTDALMKAKDFIKGKESFRAEAYYPTKNDKLTIGYGHTKDVKFGDKITQKEAEKLLKEDLNEYIDSLKHVKVRLSENEKAALTSLIYNIGGTNFYKSNLLKKLNAGDKKGAANEFDNFNKQKGKVLKGLTSRRKAEKELFLTPDNN